MNKRYKILYIQKPPGGGSLVALFEMVKRLDKVRFEPVILCYNYNNYTQLLNDLGVKIIFLQLNKNKAPVGSIAQRTPYASLRIFRQIKRYFSDDARMAKQLAKIIEENNIDLIHHNNDFPFCRQGILANKALKLPQVCHYRSLKKYTPYSFDLFIDKILSKQVDRHIYISHAVAKHFIECLKIPVGKGLVVRDIIDVNKFKPAKPDDKTLREFKIEPGEIVISCIGRIIPWKGQHIFIEAIAEVVKSHPYIKALIVGPYEKGVGDEQYYNQLKRLASTLHVADKIIFTEHRNDVPEIFSISDIIVHSSVEPEPQGLVIVEALFNSKPIIVTDAGGAGELIFNEEGGLKVAPGNVPAMAAAICKLIDSRGKETNENHTPNILKEFVPAEQIKLIEEVYDTLLH